MGMTINEHITQLKKLKSFHNGSYGASINFALDIICKYQKILEIFDRYDKGELTHEMFGLLVGEVIEDGNNTN